MRTKILLSILLVSFLGACTKDKYQTKPQLTLKKASTKVLHHNDFLTFTLEVTDAEGDIQDSMWIEQRTRNCTSGFFRTKVKMPNFTPTKNLKAEILVKYVYGSFNPGNPEFVPLVHSICPRNDSTIFRFYLKDKANNMSDTATSDEVVIVL